MIKDLGKSRYKVLIVLRRTGAVGPKSWHHVTSRGVSQWYWIATTGHKIETRWPERSYHDLIRNSGSQDMKNCSWVPNTGSQGEKLVFRGQFWGPSTQYFWTILFFHFFANVPLIFGFRDHRSSLKNWWILSWTPYISQGYLTRVASYSWRWMRVSTRWTSWRIWLSSTSGDQPPHDNRNRGNQVSTVLLPPLLFWVNQRRRRDGIDIHLVCLLLL